MERKKSDPLFWCKWKTGTYYVIDKETNTEHKFTFKDHHLPLSDKEAAIIKQSKYFGSEFYQVKKRIDYYGVSQVDATGTGRIIDQSLVNEARIRAEGIASMEMDGAQREALMSAEDAELSRVNMMRLAKKNRIDHKVQTKKSQKTVAQIAREVTQTQSQPVEQEK